MSFPKYASYKSSGVEWLGAVPAHWAVMPLKRDTAFVTSGARGWAENYSDDGDIFIRIGNLTRTSIRLDLSDIQRVKVEEGSEGARTQVQAGDVLFSITAYLGSVAVVPEGLGTAYVSQHVALARLRQQHLLPHWLAYVASSYVGRTYLETQGYGGTKVQLSLGDVSSMLVTTPPLDEQTLLTAFLDRETAKIDALVDEQKRLIELLKEKRQAAISQAVTKGLDPSVLMKDSGVAWLGKVPAHWHLKRIKHLVNCFEQGWSPQCEGYPVESDQEWGVLKVGCVNGGTFRPDENKTLPSTLEPQPDLSLLAGDLLISRANTRELVGGAAVVDRDYANLLLCDKLYRLRFDRRACTPQFIGFYLCTSGVRGQIELAATGASSSMVNIGQSTILELDVALPDLEEQEAITSYVDRVCLQLDAMTAEAESATELFQERRSALISAAVTGQIDVRQRQAEPA